MFDYSDSLIGLKYGIIYMGAPCEPDRQFVNQVFTHISVAAQGHMCECHVMVDPKFESTCLVALRFNIGNMGRRATLRASLTGNISHDEQEIELFTRAYFNDFLNYDGGSVALGWKTRPIGMEKSVDPWLNELVEEGYDFKGGLPASMNSDMSVRPRERYEETADEEIADAELIRRERERDAALRGLQAAMLRFMITYKEDPTDFLRDAVKGKYIIGGNKLSRLVVNGNFEVVLPDYNETIVTMTPLCTTLYILFLLHPEGLELTSIVDHRQRLIEIYSMVSPGSSERAIEKKICNLVDTTTNRINECMSLIKRAFKTIILTDEIASQYYITGTRGGTYRVGIPTDLVTLPRAL